MEQRWIFAANSASDDDKISWTEICGMPCIRELLKRKLFPSADDVRDFLYPKLRSLGDPFLLSNMRAAIDRIFQAIDQKERTVIFGDYDVDGVTSLALFSEIFRAYGATADLFLPLRLDEGYGLSRESIERCLEKFRPQLLIAVDCGTSSVAEIADLKRRGVDVIVIDHHEPKAALPNCVAIVNPKIEKQSAPQYLCSVGLAFKTAHALLKSRPLAGFDLKECLDLVALGTVADIVPLHGENRLLAQRGMIELGRSKKIGIRKLIEFAGLRPPITAHDIGFKLGPRLNAAGRLATAEKALRLLLTQDEAEATELAAFLDAQNRERQEVEKKTFDAAEQQLVREFVPVRDAAIVVGARGWHPGVVGIVASRLSKKYHRPAIVIAISEDGSGKGSGRSIEGLSLVEALEDCAAYLEKFGGHEMAAGLNIREEKLPAFANAFREAARRRLSDEQLQPALHLDHELALSELNRDLLLWHQLLQPFGNGNPQPLFFAREVEPSAPPEILKEKHVRFRLRQRNHFQRAIFFDAASRTLPAAPWDVAFRIFPNEYEGVTRLEIQIQALRTAAPLE